MRDPSVLGPPHPFKKGYKPKDYAVEHRVADGERWESVAARYGFTVKRLIHYNFLTVESDYVNWYLHHITGCNRTTDDINWAFSNSAQPGKIYIPYKVWDFDGQGEVITGRAARKTPISDWFTPPDDPDNLLDSMGKVLDVASAVDLGLALAAVDTPLFVALGLSALAPASTILPWASATKDAINSNVSLYRKQGYSLGLVLGVAKKKPTFARLHFLDNYHAYNAAFPQYRQAFENEYKRAFVAGYKTGQGFNSTEAVTFFQHLIANMSVHPAKMFGPDPKKWSTKDWLDYYRAAAAVFAKLHLR